MHGQNGSIFNHFLQCHNEKPTRQQLTENTIIIARANDRYKLSIKEALLILNNAPSLNIQFDHFSSILKLYNHRNQQPDIANSRLIDNSSNQPCKDLSEPPPHSLLQINTSSNCLTPSTTTSHAGGEAAEIELASPNTKVLEAGMPDLEATLLHFGIDYKKLKYVPLKNYLWWTFDSIEPMLSPPHLTHIRGSPSLEDDCVTDITSGPLDIHTDSDTEVEYENMSPTISQRIKFMVRRARRT